MKHKLPIILLLVITLLFPAMLAAQESRVLSLQEASGFALKNAPAAGNDILDEQIAQRRLDEAKTTFYPTVNGTVDVRNNIRRQTLVLPNQFDPTQPSDQVLLLQQGTRYTATGGLEASWNLLDRAATQEVRIARKNVQIASNTSQQQAIDLQIAVVKAYYTVQLYAEVLQQRVKNLDRAQRFYRDQQVKFSSQQVLRSVVNQAYLEYINARRMQEQASDDYQVSLLNLKKTIGLNDPLPLVLSDSLTALAVDSIPPTIPALETVLEKRSSYQAQLLQRQLNQLNLQQTRSRYYPALSLYGYAAGLGQTDAIGNFIGDNNVWFPWVYAGAKVTVPIFDGLQKRAIARQQRLELKKTENTLKENVLSINYEITSATSDLRNAQRAVAVRREYTRVAQEALADTRIRYQDALATAQEVLKAEATLRDCQTDYFEALYDLIIARLTWQRATGELR